MKFEVKSVHSGPPEVEAQFGSLLQAVVAGSYDDLVSNGDSNFQASVTPQMVHAVSLQLLPRFRASVASSYMGDLDRKRYKSHYWKLSFADDAGDRLVRLSIQGKKVHAFYIL